MENYVVYLECSRVRRQHDRSDGRHVLLSPVRHDEKGNKHEINRGKRLLLKKTSSATNMIMQGMDVKSVANRLGHKNCDVTLKIYIAVTNEMKFRNAEKMDEFFTKIASG